MSDQLPVLAVVLATRAGEQLTRALGSVAWARERAVLDPAVAVAPRVLPPGVALGHDVRTLASLGEAQWLLLLAEDEVAPAGFDAAVARVVSEAPVARRVGLEIDALGVRLVSHHGPVRLGARTDARLAIDHSGTLALAASRPAAGDVDGRLRAERGTSVESLFAALDPETRAWAAVLAQYDVQPRMPALAMGPMLALVRVLRARAIPRAGLARWIVAGFAAYRVVLAHTRLWEWRHAQPATVQEVA